MPVDGAHDPASTLEDRVVLVLVQPLSPENVGASVRAMANFGLRRLILVDPPAWDPETARWLAPGCAELIAGARVVATLDEALEGVHLVIATTARHRKQGQIVESPPRAAERVLDEGARGRTVAILFGREDFGLPTEAILRCEALLRIPTAEHASLNLSQAVVVVAWSLFQAAQARGARFEGRTLGGSRTERTTAKASKPSTRDRLADAVRLEPVVDEVVRLLERVGYVRAVQPDKVRLSARQALQRAALTLRHVDALRGMVSRVQWALDHPEQDWRATTSDHTLD